MTEKFSVSGMMKAAHHLMRMMELKADENERYDVIYLEDRLYGVYDTLQKQATLVYAGSPKEALRAVKGGGITMNINQMGGDSQVIGYVENMTL